LLSKGIVHDGGVQYLNPNSKRDRYDRSDSF